MRWLTYRYGCTEVVITADAASDVDTLLVRPLVTGGRGSAISRKLC